jgi:hypothetical protein
MSLWRERSHWRRPTKQRNVREKNLIRHNAASLAARTLAVAAVLVASAAMIIANAPEARAKVMKAPGSRVAIDLPLSYEISKLYNGFIMPETRLSIIVFEFPTSDLDTIKAQLTPQALAAKGFTKLARAKLKRTDDYEYFTAQQAAAKSSPSELVQPLGRVKKHILLIHEGAHAALITANVPQFYVEQSVVSPEHIARVFATAKIEAVAAPSNDPFSLSYLGPFKEAGKLQASAKLYTEDGKLVPKERGAVRNAVIIAPSINRLPVSDVVAYSRRAWDGFQGYQGLKITEEAKTTAGGLEGYWIKGTATRETPQGAAPVYLAQVILKRKGGGYFRIVLIGKASEQASLESEFAKLIAGFRPLG